MRDPPGAPGRAAATAMAGGSGVGLKRVSA
jgi:hypothetical protein